MDIEIVTIGTELLLGFTLDTNSAELGQSLSSIGVRITRRTTVGDDPGEIRAAVADALARTRTVITTGGLGPTKDDISKKCVADLFELPLEYQESVWQTIVERFRRFDRVPSESNRSQAEIPRGATVLPNRWGSAPGLWIEGPPGLVIMLPGVPHEMRKLLEHEVIPRLQAKAGANVIRSRTLRTTGIPESSLADLLGDIEAAIMPLTLAYLPGISGVDLRLTAWNFPERVAAEHLSRAAQAIMDRAKRHIYGEGESDVAALLLERAREKRLKIAVAESCTGGLVGGRITAIAGSSEVFVGGIIAYADEVKRVMLGVDPDVIETHGAVSEPVAGQMARGAAARFSADLSVAVTGIAGPDGGSEEKPVGLVWFATFAGGEVRSYKAVFGGNREEIRARAAQSALFQLYRRLQ
jgi:nicotinamide-nucleotide amidase